MAAPTSVWTALDTADWVAGALIRKTKLLQQVIQNIQWLGTSHSHSGAPGDGAAIATADAKAIWFYGDNSGPLA